MRDSRRQTIRKTSKTAQLLAALALGQLWNTRFILHEISSKQITLPLKALAKSHAAAGWAA
jgi:hypothetical protein